MDKPRLFVGSSRENVAMATAIQACFEFDMEVTVWDQGTFGPSEYPLESLEQELDQVDFGVFVFAPDDITLMRGTERRAVRDNVIFELGLFVGRLGRKRAFILMPRGEEVHLPSDLAGLTPLTYDAKRFDGNEVAALGPAARKIREAAKRNGKRIEAASTVPAETTSDATQGSSLDYAETPLPEPDKDWSVFQYEHAYFMSLLRASSQAEQRIDKAFRESEYGQDPETLAVWEAFCSSVQTNSSKRLSIANLRSKSDAFPENARLKQFLGRALALYGDRVQALTTFLDAYAKAGDISSAISVIFDITNGAASHGLPIPVDSIIERLHEFSHDGPEQVGAFQRTMQDLAKLSGLKQAQQAIAEVRIRNSPDDAYLRFSTAHAHGELERPELAMLHYECIPESERSGMVWNNLGVAYSSLRMPGKAVSAYKSASEKGESIAQGNLAQKMVASGFFEEAKKVAQDALSKPNPYINVSGALAALGTAVEEEEKLGATARASARAKQEYWTQFGCAALQPANFSIDGPWQTSEGIVVVEVDGPNYVGKGTFSRTRPVQMGLFAPTSTVETIPVELRLRRFGNAFEGTITRNQNGGGLLATALGYGERDILVFPLEGTVHLKVHISGFEAEEAVWFRPVGSPALLPTGLSALPTGPA